MYLINKRSLNNIVALDFLKNRLGNLKSHSDASINKIMPEYKKEEEIFNDSHNITFRYNEKSYDYLKKNLVCHPNSMLLNVGWNMPKH